MKRKGFEIVITLLLSTLVGIGVYFVNKLEACEVRIWTLETTTPGNAGEIKALETKIDLFQQTTNDNIRLTAEGLKGQIDLLQRLVLQLLSKSGVDTSRLNLQVGNPVDGIAQERAP